MDKARGVKTSQNLLYPQLSMLTSIMNILDGSVEYRFFCNVFKYGTLPRVLGVLQEE